VPAGEYTLAVSLVGYASSRQTVVVEAGETLSVDIQLEVAPISLDEVFAVADRPYTTVSSRAVRAFDIRTRPVRSTQDLLRLAPGLVTAQHAGGGKAEQIFLRGFDADHGTDVAISVDGVPVNMVSHGHGQGYADLHYVIPEVIEAIDVVKGPYFAEYGNLATAGAVSFRTRDHLDANEIRVEAGAFNTAGITALYQIPTSGPHRGAYFAGNFLTTDGPFEAEQNFQRFNLFAKTHYHLGDGAELSFDAGAYGAAWDASGQIPVRAVESGRIDRFGAIDALEGGTTGHQHINAQYMSTTDRTRFKAQAYAVRYDFKLFSNFTFFLENPEAGDMIEQTDTRTLYGFTSSYRLGHALPVGLGFATIGGGVRSDDISVSLWQSPDRVRETQFVDADIAERNFFLWAEEEAVLSEHIRLLLGLRGDYFTFDVNDRLDTDPSPPGGLPHASGYADALIVSPKANLVISPTRSIDVFLNAGLGFHSNDARDVVITQRINEQVRALRQRGLSEAEINAALRDQRFDPAQRGGTVLPQALGTEVGTRIRPSNWLIVGVAAWLLDLEEEFVYVGDAGTTEPSGRTRRVGVDVEARVQILPWMAADADMTLSRGRLRDAPEGENVIPLAPTLTSTGGLTAQHPADARASLRYRHISDRPANEDDSVTAQGYTVVDALAGYTFGRTELTLTLENLFNVAWNEAQFDTTSQLPGEAAPVSELHFTPGNPFNIRLGVNYRF
jgi:outer membrane receptor protein involved in Fe transport